MSQSTELALSGDRFTAVYHLKGTRDEATRCAHDICVEQTVEFPEDLIESPAIREQIMGEVHSLDTIGPDRHRAVIRFPVEVAGRELTQLLNVLFGNISLKPGIRLVSLALPESLAVCYRGPRFGQNGLRERLGIYGRPLLSTAIKPMGVSITALADMAYQLALGGVDIIKDDHGLTDQVFGRFEERLVAVSSAVRRANDQTGQRCLYAPNVTAPAGEVMHRARLAKQCGAGGLLIAPGLTGLDTMRRIADDDAIALPILSHPAMQGAFTAHEDTGICHGLLYGTLNRLAGADATIFPNCGGRFSFTPEACRDISNRAKEPMGHIKPIFPVPAGGMSLDRVAEIKQFYGEDLILLIGGDLHRHGESLSESAKKFVDAL